MDLRNLLAISEAIAKAALERKESRGGHFRDDYPAKDPEAAKYNILVRRGQDGAMELTREPIPPLREDLRKLIEEQK
jgi:succinate dehydrogenase / fumarate reductase flavoprotein subunit